MASKGTQRKLTAILCADVAGYSRLMGADEEATIETLTAYRKVFTSEIKKHRGRVVDAKGDAILAEFASVVDAVNGAVEIQRELAERNTDLLDDRRMDFRIGINLGDVVMKDDAIYGDGVNVAARLEALAEPGGICISRPVYDQVESKLNLECEYLGEQEVKNIAKPVRAYKVSLNATGNHVEPTASDSPAPTVPGPTTKGRAQPSIVVLPFKNMSGDSEQEYFSDGITEDLITDLSKISRLSVVSQNTAFTYKGRTVNVQQVGKELGVSYVLEGSVRKAGNRLRITAQLIDAVPDRHLWSERYDRDLEDVFAVQDEITRNIVTALDVSLLEGEQALIWRRSTNSGDAYDLFQRARSVMLTVPSREGNALAFQLFQKAIDLDPNFARAYAGLAQQRMAQAREGWSRSREESIQQAFEIANKAIVLDDSLAEPHQVLSQCHLNKGEFEKALAEAEKAVALNPTGGDVYAYLGLVQTRTGEAALAVENVRKAMRITPNNPHFYLLFLGAAQLILRDYGQALATLKETAERLPDSRPARLYLAAAYAALDQCQEAEAQAREVLRIDPRFELEKWSAAYPFQNPEDFEHLVNLLRKAGLPDGSAHFL